MPTRYREEKNGLDFHPDSDKDMHRQILQELFQHKKIFNLPQKNLKVHALFLNHQRQMPDLGMNGANILAKHTNEECL